VVLNLTVCQAFNVSDAGAVVPSGGTGRRPGSASWAPPR